MAGQERERDSARRMFIGWMQKRQRECVTIISLGCVTVTFAQTAIAGASSTLGVAVVLIPVTVHLLLVRDVWMKWGQRCAARSTKTDFTQVVVDVVDDRRGVLGYVYPFLPLYMRIQFSNTRTAQYSIK